MQKYKSRNCIYRVATLYKFYLIYITGFVIPMLALVILVGSYLHKIRNPQKRIKYISVPIKHCPLDDKLFCRSSYTKRLSN